MKNIIIGIFLTLVSCKENTQKRNNSKSEKENKTEKVSFEKERLSIEMGLELKIPIDPMKDSVERWFILLVELEKKVEYLSKKNNGKSN